jgi:hypothetical protein
LLADINRLTRQVRGYRWRDAKDEERAESALRLVARELESLNLNSMNPPDTTAQANALIAAADEWTSLASYICCRVYAPASPMPRRLLKWGRKVAELLRFICSLIELPIRSAALFLGASGWSVAVNFPWGVSISLEFDMATGSSPGLSTTDKVFEELQRQLTETKKSLQEAQFQIAHRIIEAKQTRMKEHAPNLSPPE